ncbi:MAG: sporulation transcriptional regulator SpoIIID [Eubacteriales bacterium]|nr:sporulation transcriptional regulator SpoIIID [Eubacteriales bacterium]MDD4475135.1 sporulation transcriptional regulator SpoIIID [Eubacteriales bacterium]
MNSFYEHRVRDLAVYVIENKATVRKTASVFGISKSTVHKDLSKRLKKISPILFSQVDRILQINKQQRHIRGGNATKLKYMKKSHSQDEKELPTQL